MNIKKYLLNCFILLIPMFIWNMLLYDKLPEGFNIDIFWKNIPKTISYPENIFRILVFALPIAMSLNLKTKSQKWGMVQYTIGTLIYFLSWLMLIKYPESEWSKSMIGFTAPAYTPIIWLIGIALIGKNTLYLKRISLVSVYILLSVIFVIFHTWHTYIVYVRL